MVHFYRQKLIKRQNGNDKGSIRYFQLTKWAINWIFSARVNGLIKGMWKRQKMT